MKRACLFAAYNYANVISEYVIEYLKEISQYADVYYMADGQLPKDQIEKISPYVKGAWVENHGGYDFFSWKLLVTKYVGWEIIDEYDEIIFANDSCFCVNSFLPVFDKMSKKTDLDIWGLSAADEQNVSEVSRFEEYYNKNTEHFFIGSYFWVVRKRFLHNPDFRRFLNNICILETRYDVYREYELGIIRLARESGVKLGVWDEMVWRYSSSYMRDAFNLIKSGYPLLKVRIFIDNIGGQTLMDQLAKATVKFCTIDYSKYISQVRTERNIKVCLPKKKRKSYRIKKALQSLIPPLIQDLFRIKKLRKLPQVLRSSLLYIIPPFVVELTNHFFAHCMRTKRVEFALASIPRPEYGGYYPCHIHDYDSIQKSRVDKLKRAKSIVVFFNVMRPVVSGGMLSIDRFVHKSISIANAHNFQIVQSNLPLKNACMDNPYFDYSLPPIDFSYIVKYTSPQKLQLNIPECFVPSFLNEITAEQYVWLWSIPKLIINVLNQSDELMPDRGFLEELRTLCNNNLIMTAAHQRYCTAEKSRYYNCPIYLLTPFLPDFYRVPFGKKKKRIVLSPDENVYREEIVYLLEKELPEYEIVTVAKMKLDDYKKLISESLFTITFGEGYDGYFIEPYLSDSLAFSIRNPRFFPVAFAEVPTVYPTWDVLKCRIIKDIRHYERTPSEYERISNLVEFEIRKYTNNDQSEKDLASYYQRFLNS